MAETGFADIATKEIGGVPAWALGLGAAGVIIGYTYFFRDDSGSTQTVYSDDDMQPEEGEPSNSDYGLPEGPIGDWLAENPGYAGYPVGSSPLTNAQWGRYVSDRMLSAGSDPSIVSSAISKFLGGLKLTEAEAAVIRLAKQQYGETPEGVLAIIVGDNTTPNTDPQPAPGSTRGYGWYKVRKGDSITSISRKYNKTAAELWAYNGMALNRLTPGEWLKVRFNSNPIAGYKG